MQRRSAARIVAIALASVAYVAGSHWLMTQTQASAWNAVGVLSPMLTVVALGAWRSGHLGVAAAAVLAFLALCAQATWGEQVPASVLYLAQHAGINGCLALFFGSTLRRGRTPLITTLALRVHRGHLVAGQHDYTRRLTQAWVILFAAIVGVSLALFAFASFEAWAVFANLITPVAIGGLLIGEHLIRFRLHPEFERSSVADAVRAYMQNAKADTQPAVQASQGHPVP